MTHGRPKGTIPSSRSHLEHGPARRLTAPASLALFAESGQCGPAGCDPNESLNLLKDDLRHTRSRYLLISLIKVIKTCPQSRSGAVTKRSIVSETLFLTEDRSRDQVHRIQLALLHSCLQFTLLVHTSGLCSRWLTIYVPVNLCKPLPIPCRWKLSGDSPETQIEISASVFGIVRLARCTSIRTHIHQAGTLTYIHTSYPTHRLSERSARSTKRIASMSYI